VLRRLTRFERRNEPVASMTRFGRRVAANFAAALVLIFVSLIIGMFGYVFLEGMGVVDAYLNASMILGGMGPVGTLNTTAGKVFAGTYALYCGVVLIFSTGIILAPVIHRLLHEFHVDSEEETDIQQRRRH